MLHPLLGKTLVGNTIWLRNCLWLLFCSDFFCKLHFFLSDLDCPAQGPVKTSSPIEDDIGGINKTDRALSPILFLCEDDGEQAKLKPLLSPKCIRWVIEAKNFESVCLSQRQKPDEMLNHKAVSYTRFLQQKEWSSHREGKQEGGNGEQNKPSKVQYCVSLMHVQMSLLSQTFQGLLSLDKDYSSCTCWDILHLFPRYSRNLNTHIFKLWLPWNADMATIKLCFHFLDAF